MAVFFTSDTHFGDHGVLNIRPRPFGSVTEMNEVIITRWNSRVGPGDEIWHLGDFARRLKVAEAILPRLNGRKHLVTGNNDEPAVCALNWSSVQAYTELIVDGVMLVLCHYEPPRVCRRLFVLSYAAIAELFEYARSRRLLGLGRRDVADGLE